MLKGLQHLHSSLAYLVLAGLLLSGILFLVRRGSGSFSAGDKRLALITLILTHVQLILGLILYFVGPKGFAYFDNPDVMTNNTMRLYALEHILINILAISLITIGYSRAKRATAAKRKYTLLASFYLVGLVLILSRIPWEIWL